MKAKLTLWFTPQAWVNDYAIEVDCEGDREWVVTWEGDEVPDDDTYESDELRYMEGTPAWIADWSGPFYISILGVEQS